MEKVLVTGPTAGIGRAAVLALAGMGRHVIGSNYFYYTRDPFGSFAEYYHDLDFIPEQCAWAPRDFPEEDWLYFWGPPPPPEFTDNVELA